MLIRECAPLCLSLDPRWGRAAEVGRGPPPEGSSMQLGGGARKMVGAKASPQLGDLSLRRSEDGCVLVVVREKVEALWRRRERTSIAAHRTIARSG
jgi:hypothetical protein